jgi:DNA-directed RNA polymerase delta subunit
MNSTPLDLALLVIKNLNSRSQDIIKKRYGLLDNKPKTLEAIGKDYKITRERVRQIINAILNNIKKPENLGFLKEFYELCFKVIKENGGIYEEKSLLSKINELTSKEDQRQAINFLLSLNDNFVFEEENDSFRAFWRLKEFEVEKFKKIVKGIEKYFKEKNKSLTFEEIFEFVKKHLDKNISAKVLEVYLGLSLNIQRNVFGEYGLNSLRDINPNGAREKAYLILKHFKKPMHFTEIAKHLNEFSEKAQAVNASLRWFKKVEVQTVHNELIKDPRFVLIGRGIYALRDWGYKPGKVIDVIKEILVKANKPLTQEKIIEEVKKYRLAKDNTIILNLHNKRYFKKLPNKKFVLIRKKTSQPKVLEI